MSITRAKELFFEGIQKGSLMEINDLTDFLKEEKEIELVPWEKKNLELWLNDQNNFSPLKTFILDPRINEILVHEKDQLQIEKDGELFTLPWQQDDVSLEQLFEILALKEHQSWNYQKPFRSFRVELIGETFRATLLHKSLSPYNKAKLFLRRLKTNQIRLKDFHLGEEVNNFLLQIVREKKNILFCGSTGSGKTTLMSALLNEVSEKEHVVVMEDTHELSLNKEHFTFLLAEEETPKKTLKDYCKYAMRLRPDRIVIGELRGEETVPFLLSMNNGHKGLMSTIHAHSATEAPMRLAMLFSLYSDTVNMNLELVLKLVCANVDYIIHLKDKKINEIVNLLGSEGSMPYVEKIF